MAQTFQDWELILVDDGSPDRSGAIGDEYAAKDSRIRVIHKANGGVSAARQDGLDAAQGDYVIHVDPDDWIERDMLQALYEKAVADNADMVICDYFEDCEGVYRRIRQRPSNTRSETVFRELFQEKDGGTKLHGSCWNKLVRRSLFEKFGIRFPQGYTILEDLSVIARLCAHEIKIGYLNRPLYHYVQDANQNGLGHRFTKLSVDSIVGFCDSFEALWDARGMASEKEYWRYCAKAFAYQSGCYTPQAIRGIYAEENMRVFHKAVACLLSRPYVLEVWLGQCLPRGFGRMCTRILSVMKKLLSPKQLCGYLRAYCLEEVWSSYVAIGEARPKKVGNLKFCADPFLFRWNGRNWLFCEALDGKGVGYCKGGKGYIGCYQEECGKWVWEGNVLEEPWHLSYPQVFEENGHVYMIPESYDFGHGGVYLYEAKEFPYKWERVAKLIDKPFADATVLKHDNHWYMACFLDPTTGERPSAELWHAPSLSGPWERHAMWDKINQSNRLRRCAGRFLVKDGCLFRVAQDCNGGYGKRVFAVRIEKLSPLEYKEGEATLLLSTAMEPRGFKHTYNEMDVDGVKYATIDVHNTVLKRPYAIIRDVVSRVKRRLAR